MISTAGKTTIGALTGAGVGYVIGTKITESQEGFNVAPFVCTVGGALAGGALAFFLWK